eukprot:scpid95036/ scgid23767/ 
MRIALRLGFSQCENCRHKLRAYFDFSNSWCNVSIGCCFSKQRTMTDPVGAVSDAPVYNDSSIFLPQKGGGLLFLCTVPTGVSDGSPMTPFIVRGKNDQLFSKTFEDISDAAKAGGGFTMFTCTVKKSCTYELRPPQHRVAFQTPGEKRFMGTNLSWNGSTLSWNVQQVNISTPEKAMFRPEGHFIFVETPTKDVFELHSGISQEVVLAVSHVSTGEGNKLVMMPLADAKKKNLTYSYKIAGKDIGLWFQ